MLETGILISSYFRNNVCVALYVNVVGWNELGCRVKANLPYVGPGLKGVNVMSMYVMIMKCI